MKWLEVTVQTTHEGGELVSDIFFENDCTGVSILDNFDIIELINSERNWDYLADGLLNENSAVLVKGFIEMNSEKLNSIAIGLEKLKENSSGFLDLGSLKIAKREIDDEVWIEIWKKHYKPIHIKNVTICPVWIDYKPKKTEMVVKIDPGMAFGTGEHETTVMCIDLLQEYDLTNKAVIDVGCGSGILGIASIKLNCKSCYMTDIDPLAKQAAEKNALINGISTAIIKCGNLLDDTDIKGDIIIINIVADVLINLSKNIKNHLNKNGVVILSGIINSRYHDVLTAYEKQGFKLSKKLVTGEWTALAMKMQD